MLKRLDDEELLRRERHAREMAHNAPKSEPGVPSDAWSRWSREWCDYRKEVERRGLLHLASKP